MLCTKSFLSIKSLSDNKLASDSLTREETLHTPIPTTVFEDLLPYTVKQCRCTFDVFVKKSFVIDSSSNHKAGTKSTLSSRRSTKTTHLSQFIAKGSGQTIPSVSKSIIIGALYDDDNELVEIQIVKQRVPRQLVCAIAIIAPLYDVLQKITIKECIMDLYTTFELSRITNLSKLTEICLDGSFTNKANYAVLLETPSYLKHLSLCSCRIDDFMCESIVSKLHYQSVAEKQLLTLHLSRNYITDKGAEFVSTMLRSNRYLRYLNLAGNQLTDEGARLILNVLRDFRLTTDENTAKRHRILNYIKRKNKLISKFSASSQMSKATTNISRKLRDLKNLNLENKKEYNPKDKKKQLKQTNEIASQLIGQDRDPFGFNRTILKEGWAYCKGNFTLCYLNLSFNYLTYLSVKRVLDLFNYQHDTDKLMEPGLLKIVFEGNDMPASCPEYTQISEIINKSLLPHTDSISSKKRRNSRLHSIKNSF